MHRKRKRHPREPFRHLQSSQSTDNVPSNRRKAASVMWQDIHGHSLMVMVIVRSNQIHASKSLQRPDHQGQNLNTWNTRRTLQVPFHWHLTIPQMLVRRVLKAHRKGKRTAPSGLDLLNVGAHLRHRPCPGMALNYQAGHRQHLPAVARSTKSGLRSLIQRNDRRD